MPTLFSLAILLYILSVSGGDPNPEVTVVNGSAFNSSIPKEIRLRGIIDSALEKEFSDIDEHSDVPDRGSFTNNVEEQQAVLEMVARIKSKKNDTKVEKVFELHDVFNLDNENGVEDMPTLIDRKENIFIMSNPKSKFPVLKLDLRFISDLVVVIVSATCGGIAFSCAGQPVITGYLLAGSVIGPGGFGFVSEMIQLCGGKASDGVFVGVYLSMSSTAVAGSEIFDG